jgi:integrase
MRGSIVKRGTRYSVVLELDRDPLTGKRRREWHSGYRTKRDAEAARVEILSRLQRGEYVAPSKLTVADYLEDRWLPAKTATLAPSTHASYSRNVRCHIVPGIGSAPLQGLSADVLTRFYAERLRSGGRSGKGLSARTVRYLHAIVHKALADALAWGLVVRNVADAAEPPSHRAAKAVPPKTWSAGELRTFLESVSEDRLYALWLLHATTGLRRGEALGLRWPALDLDVGQLSIREARVTAGYDVHGSAPKSERGRRAVALDPATVAALRAHRKRQLTERLAWGPAYQDSDEFVFCREDGSPLHPDDVSKRFSAAVAAIDVPRITLHGLRHTWASLALQAGVSPKVVSERLGHASVSFTLDVYSHVMPGMQEDAAAKVASLVLDG